MKKFIPLLLCLMLFLSACSGEPDPDAVNFDDKPTLPIEEVSEFPMLTPVMDGTNPANSIEIETEMGKIVGKDMDGEHSDYQLISFEDPVTGETYPLCARANCTHDSFDCPAYQMFLVAMHYDGEYLYIIGEDQGEDNNLDDVLIRQKLDGSDRKIVCRLTDTSEGGTASVFGAVFQNGMVYYKVFGSVFDEETKTLNTKEQIWVADLTTGKVRSIPINFNNGGNGSTLGFLGMYGKELILERYTDEVGKQRDTDYRFLYFLLNVETYEITVILDVMDIEGGGKLGWDYLPEYGLLWFQLRESEYEVNENATIIGDEEQDYYSLYDGDLRVVDLQNRKVYQISDVPLAYRNGIRSKDGQVYWIYQTYNEDRSEIIKYAQNITTGETYLYNEIFH